MELHTFYSKNSYNLEQLDAEIRAQFPQLIGLEMGDGGGNLAGIRVVMPENTTQQTLTAIQNLVTAHSSSVLTASQQSAQDRTTIINKAQLALAYMGDLKLILDKIVDHDIASASLATRYASLSGIVDTQVSSAFKNRFNAALQAEQNIDMSLLGILGLTSNQQRTYLTYLRIFVNQYCLLALFGSL